MKITKSLKAKGHNLSDSLVQLNVLNNIKPKGDQFPKFATKLKDQAMFPLKPKNIEILQVNVGKMCNQTCGHCHVDAGPDRKEIMTRDTMRECLEALKKGAFHTIDLTGGAPEMNPDFRMVCGRDSKSETKHKDYRSK